MNRQRKQRFDDVISFIEDARNELDDIQAEEQEAFDNLSDGLQASSRGDTIQTWLDIMDEIGDKIDELSEWIRNKVFTNKTKQQ